MELLNAADARAMLITVADAVIAEKPLLTEVDSAIGDGDHGIGMEGGLKKAKDKLLAMQNTNNVYELFTTMGKTMLMSMGGASGVIFGSMFLAGAKDMTPSESLSAMELAALMQKSLDAIMVRGGAQVGDKTMVDALAPAVSAMLESAGDGLLLMLQKAEQAAAEGMESTKRFEAKFGRAKTQKSTIGFQDAGATSVWIIFRAMRDFMESR